MFAALTVGELAVFDTPLPTPTGANYSKYFAILCSELPPVHGDAPATILDWGAARRRSLRNQAPKNSVQAGTRFGVGSSGNPGWPVSASPSACISCAFCFNVERTAAILS